jgi:hypothetical protein
VAAVLAVGLLIVTGFHAAPTFGAPLVLARGGYALVALPDAVPRVATWVLVGLLGLGALMNFASSSPWERFGWGPFTLVLIILGVVLARTAVPAGRAAARR